LPAVTGRQKRGVPSWEFFADREEFDRLCHKAETWRGVEPWWDTCGIGLALPVQEMLLAFSNYPRSAASAIFTIPVALIAKEDRPGRARGTLSKRAARIRERFPKALWLTRVIRLISVISGDLTYR